MRPDGTLDWTPPAGNWVVLRFGYSLLGITNHPATAEATGLEVDKLNHGHVKNYMDHYLDSYKNTVGADYMGKRGIRYVITDSWEAGAQNWTEADGEDDELGWSQWGEADLDVDAAVVDVGLGGGGGVAFDEERLLGLASL